MQHPFEVAVSFYEQTLNHSSVELTANTVRDELVERCKAGDSSSYQLLYQRYSKAMYNTSLRIVNNTADAEDVLQEAFLDAFRSLHDFHYRSTFGAWLKKIVINKSINTLRKRRGYTVEIDEEREDGVHAIAQEDPIDEAEIQYRVDEVKRGIQRLPDGYRAVVSLYLLEGYDQEEIAGILGISHNTVRTQYVRAKQKLLNIIKQGV